MKKDCYGDAMVMESLMVGFEPKEGETEQVMSLEDTIRLVEEEVEMALSYEEKVMEASYIPAKPRAIRRKATARHNRRDVTLTSHIHKDYGLKVRKFNDGTVRVMSTKFHRKEHIPVKQEKRPRYGINSYLKEYGL